MPSFLISLIVHDTGDSLVLDGVYDKNCKDEIFEVLYHAAALGLDVLFETEFYPETEKEN